MAKAARKRPGRSRAEALSHKLQDLLAEAQRKEPAPKGFAKCPLCGAAVEPTKTARVRVHDDPVRGSRCAAGGQPWAYFGKAAPRPGLRGKPKRRPSAR